MNNNYHVGIDIGSTTIKVVILNHDGELIYKKYERHYADIRNKLYNILYNAYGVLKNTPFTIMITGSAGMNIAKGLDVYKRQIFSMDELIELFDLKRVNKSGAIFDINKLNWMNAHYIRESSVERITRLSIPYLLESGHIKQEDIEYRYGWIEMMVESLKDKVSILSEISEKAALFFNDEVTLEDDECRKILDKDHISALVQILKEKISSVEDLTPEVAKKIFKEIQKEHGIKGKDLFMPVRVMLTGQMHGPDLMKIIAVLGVESILNRLEYVAEKYI